MPSLIEGRRLAALLHLTETELQELAQAQRLPFGFSGRGGLFIQASDLPQWRAVAQSFMDK